MIISVDITGAKFNCVDIDSAWIYALPPRLLDDVLVLEFWGLHFKTVNSPVPIPQLPFASRDDSVFVNGWAKVEVKDLKSLEFTVALYDRSRSSFLKDHEGNPITLERVIAKESTASIYEYNFGGELVWPNGNAQITVQAAGAVTAAFSTETCITGKDFEKNRSSIAPPP